MVRRAVAGTPSPGRGRSPNRLPSPTLGSAPRTPGQRRKPPLTGASVKTGNPSPRARFRMVFAVAFFVNSAANFVFGIVLSALLGPAEFGRYATVALAANTLAAAVFDWLRQSSLRFSGENTGRAGIAASLDAGYLAVMAALFVGVAAAGLSGLTYGVSLAALLLTPFLALALGRIDYAGAQFRAREQQVAFAALYGFRQVFSFTAVVAVAYCTRDWALTIAALAVANLAAAIALSAPLRTPGARLRQASGARLAEFSFTPSRSSPLWSSTAGRADQSTGGVGAARRGADRRAVAGDRSRPASVPGGQLAPPSCCCSSMRCSAPAPKARRRESGSSASTWCSPCRCLRLWRPAIWRWRRPSRRCWCRRPIAGTTPGSVSNWRRDFWPSARSPRC